MLLWRGIRSRATRFGTRIRASPIRIFSRFWEAKGFYSPIKSCRIESAEVPPKGGSGVVVVLELSGYSPFPKPEETVKFGQNHEVMLWVERSDQSLSFPPP